ncbi:aminoglycoside 6-adenylyltransferase [Sediminibacillus halophilus]|uniref:Aminoglycoside 6-adenylyltransferase n=1 Tax=Sediminibacillus halophilus TaxID=482461 RepID=A0A1G9VBF3_9BACI|nr:aminoglycoside 6-adenylyltransferase [Sediminibacillus halophilus]SDM69387.1 aminoglycoside 6-adenylyltransferase [Sediminibacillus halophilus]
MISQITFDDLIDRFVLYAEESENIRAAFLVGSRARVEMPADEWADLDLVVFTKNPALLLNNTNWLSHLGKPVITFLERTAVGDSTERRVLFEGGLDVDFAFFPVASLPELEKNAEVLDVLAKGVKVVIDKDDITRSIIQKAEALPPSDRGVATMDIENLIHDFWYHAYLAAKKFRRGELLDGKSICDGYMKDCLTLMMKVQVKARKDADFQTWHGYRFFERWTGPKVSEEFKKLYARYELKEMWEALKNTMDFFRTISADVCRQLNIVYPNEAAEYATELVDTLNDNRDGT